MYRKGYTYWSIDHLLNEEREEGGGGTISAEGGQYVLADYVRGGQFPLADYVRGGQNLLRHRQKMLQQYSGGGCFLVGVGFLK